MDAGCVNIAGLVANMLGVCIVFFYGYPQPSFDEIVTIDLGDGTTFTDGTSVASIKAGIRRRKRKHLIISRTGLGLLGLGFALQLAAVMM